MKKYNIHLVASNKEAKVKDLLEKINEFQGQEIEINISKWNYSFLALNYFLTNEMDEEPDIILIFDNAEFSKTDGATGKVIGYKKMLEAIRNAKVNLQKSKIVIILSPEVKEDKELVRELMKLDIQNFYFADDSIDIDFLKSSLFGCEKTYEDNAKYLEVDSLKPVTSVIKYVDRVIEKPILQTEVVEKIIEKEVIISQSIGAITIAVGGTKIGAGTTNMAVAIAKYLKTINKKVALAELNNYPSLNGIDIPNIDVYPQEYVGYKIKNPKNILNNMNIDNYQYIVLDLGSLYQHKSAKECDISERTAENTEYFYEMNRSHIAILVHPGGEWNLKYFIPFSINNDVNKKWKIALTHTDKIDKRIKEEFKDCYIAPYHLNIKDDETINFMQDILKEIVGIRKYKKRFIDKIPFFGVSKKK